MVEEWGVPVWAVLATAAVAAFLLVATLVSTVRVRGQVAALRARIGVLEAREVPAGAALPVPPPDAEDHVITTVRTPAQRADEPGRAVPAPLFVDLVLRESVVQAASWTAGLRRALSPEVRNRIRFEVRREVKRSRRQRRADLRQARRARSHEARSHPAQGSAA